MSCDHNCIPCSRWFRRGWVCVRCGRWFRSLPERDPALSGPRRPAPDKLRTVWGPF